MTFLKQVEPYLLSDNKTLQHFAFRILQNSFHATEETFLVALKANDQAEHPPMVNTILPYIRKYPISEEGFIELLNRFKVADKRSGQHFFYLQVVTEVEPYLIDKYRHEIIVIIGEGNKSSSAIIDTYTEFCHDELNVLINKLEKLTEELDRTDNYDGSKFSLARKIVKVIAEKHHFQREQIKKIINEEKNNDIVSYKLIFMIMLAGHLKMEDLISIMVDLLITRLDDDVLVAEVTESLVKIGNEKVIEEIKPYIIDEEIGSFAVDVIKNIKIPFAEEALLSSFIEVEDNGVKTVIADALCQQLSIKAIPLIESLIEEGYEEWLLDLEESLYSNCAINNIDHPKLSEWKSMFEAEEERLNELWYQENKTKNDLGSQKTKLSPTKVEKKVGRNDQCTCGSGKKHKKCCL